MQVLFNSKKIEIVVSDLIRNALEPVLIPIEIKEQTVSIKGEETVSFLGDLNWTSKHSLIY